MELTHLPLGLSIARKDSYIIKTFVASIKRYNICTVLKTGTDPAFVIRDGPNSEHFLSNLWKLLKIGKFFLLTTLSLIVKRN